MTNITVANDNAHFGQNFPQLLQSGILSGFSEYQSFSIFPELPGLQSQCEKNEKTEPVREGAVQYSCSLSTGSRTPY